MNIKVNPWPILVRYKNTFSGWKDHGKIFGLDKGTIT